MFEFFEAIENSWLISSISGSNLLYGTFTAMHYFTLFILTGTAVAFDLHLLGFVAKKQTTADFADEVFPWIWTAMGFALFSGFTLFLTGAGEFYSAPSMQRKILVVLVAIACTVFIQRGAQRWGKESSLPVSAKLSAVVSIVLWIWGILEGNNVAALCGLG